MTPAGERAIAIWGSSEANADMFAAVPISIIDSFLYLEAGGRRVAVIAGFERERVEALGTGLEVRDHADFGRAELLKDGWDGDIAGFEVALRACRDYGVEAVDVPFDFPLAVAEHLRAGGIDVRVDTARLQARRRAKSAHQIAGVRRAQAAADAAMGLAAGLLRECAGGLTAEAVRGRMHALCERHGCVLPDDVVVAVNAQGAAGHDKGSGPITPGDRVLVDIWPRDRESRCFADMTRTFVAGGAEPDTELARYWELARTALEAVLPAIRPGITGRALYDLACDVFEAAGEPTMRDTEGSLDRGFFHSLGHGVGIDIHEAPGLGLAGSEALVEGDVIAVEPGCYRPGFGGVRLEDLVLVTAGGSENLTQFPYGLAP